MRPTSVEIVWRQIDSSAGGDDLTNSPQPRLERKAERLWQAEFEEPSSAAARLHFNGLLACRAAGSWPPANLLWSASSPDFPLAERSYHIENEANRTSPDGTSLAPLELASQPAFVDRTLDGAEFVCKASNEHLSAEARNASSLEARLRISVRCKCCSLLCHYEIRTLSYTIVHADTRFVHLQTNPR